MPALFLKKIRVGLWLLFSLSLFLGVANSAFAEGVASDKAQVKPRVRLTTDLGDIVIQLFPDKAPVTVQNFLDYVDARFYDGVIFHRVVPGFVVQSGGLTFDFVRKQTRDQIVNESSNGLKNVSGTLAMARYSDPDSASSQFFINLKHNKHLDGKKSKAGYTVFGRVLIGMEVALKISKEPRGLYRSHPEAPNVPIRILKARRL